MAVPVATSRPSRPVFPEAVKQEPFTGLTYGLPSPPPSPESFPVSRGENKRSAPQQNQHTQHPRKARRSQPLQQQPTPESRIGKCLGRIVLGSVLGVGAYGVVYKAIDVVDGQHYAVKALSKFNSNGTPLDQRQQDFQRREIYLHYQASAHSNIVSMHKIIDDVDCTYVVMEYCSEGDLFSNITERHRYMGNEELVRKVALQILDAVAHCHSLGIYHRDLKPENILVADRGNNVMLADFGLATTDPYSIDFGCGSTFYMSPECQNQSSRSQWYACAPNDIWSLGVILVNLTCGRNPWKQASPEDSTFREYMKDRHFLKTILPLSDEFDDILGMIFELDPTRRISLDQLRFRIMNCPLFVDSRPVSERPSTRRTLPYAQFLAPPVSPAAITGRSEFAGSIAGPSAFIKTLHTFQHSASSNSSSSSVSSSDTMMSDNSDNSIGSDQDDWSDSGYVGSPERECTQTPEILEGKSTHFHTFDYANQGQYEQYDTVPEYPFIKQYWNIDPVQNTFYTHPSYAPCVQGY